MQPVAELVEQGGDLVEAEQCLLPLRRLGDVEYVDHDRGLPDEVVLVDEAAHPRSAALRGPGEEVREQQADRRTVHVSHLPDLHIGVVTDEIGPQRHPDPVEPFRGEEDTVAQHA